LQLGQESGFPSLPSPSVRRPPSPLRQLFPMRSPRFFSPNDDFFYERCWDVSPRHRPPPSLPRKPFEALPSRCRLLSSLRCRHFFLGSSVIARFFFPLFLQSLPFLSLERKIDLDDFPFLMAIDVLSGCFEPSESARGCPPLFGSTLPSVENRYRSRTSLQEAFPPTEEPQAKLMMSPLFRVTWEKRKIKSLSLLMRSPFPFLFFLL